MVWEDDYEDGFWIEDLVLDYDKLHARMDMRMRVKVGDDREVAHLRWESKPMNGVNVSYYFVNCEAVDGEGSNRFVKSDVYVKFVKKAGLDDAIRRRWMLAAILLRDSGSVDVNLLVKITSKYVLLHQDDMQDVQTRLLDCMKDPMSIDEGDFMLMVLNYVANLYELDKKVADVTRVCNWCAEISTAKLKQCSCSSGVRYCSVQCQGYDWPNHKSAHASARG